MSFLPDFTEHPKPKRQKTKVVRPSQQPQPLQLNPPADGGEEDEGEGEVEVTFLQDLVAGGMAGSASVIVGHPLDTLKVRVQNSASSSASSSSSLAASIAEFGGLSSLFRGMGAPLSAAAVVNAIVFSSYGLGSRMYDCYVPASASFSSPSSSSSHDPWQKSMTCGAFAGLVQCAVICPMEHVKCRLQVQHDGPGGYRGPYHAARSIAKDHGLRRLYQGWWSTVSREVPAFGLYFAVYDYMKDNVNTWLARQEQQRHQQPAFRTAGIDRTSAATMTAAAVSPAPETPSSAVRHTHTWMASACAGGIAGSVTWGVVYPVDVSTCLPRRRTSPLATWTASPVAAVD
jgi:solute carrier family 25 carnitine/acylcarnitine transporter 20/29